MPHLNTFENLDDLLDAAVLENLCTTMSCGTCGAGFFRQKIAAFLAHKLRAARVRIAGNTCNHKLSAVQVKVLAEELRKVTSGAICSVRPSLRRMRASALDFLIREVWNYSPSDTREEWMRLVLAGSLAGLRYEAMLAHYKKDLSRWAAENERNSPEALAMRKAEKVRLRDERLKARAIRKKGIDRA